MSDYKLSHSGLMKIKKDWYIKKRTLEDIKKEREMFDNTYKNNEEVNKKITSFFVDKFFKFDI